jgi:hypothetical protein
MRHDQRRAWVEVDLGALKRNASMLAQRARVPLLPMVKADAYGLGAEAVVGALESLAPWGYGSLQSPRVLTFGRWALPGRSSFSRRCWSMSLKQPTLIA